MAAPAAGTWTASVTYSCSLDSGTVTHQDYWLAVYTGWMLSGKRLFAAADCIGDTAGIQSVTSGHPFDSPTSGVPSGNSRAMYRLATLASGMYSGSMLSGMLSGRRLYAAERDPCCDGGPFAPVVNSGIASGDGGGEATCYCGTHPIPATLYATTQDAVSGVFPLYYTGTTGGPYPAEQCINFLSDPDIIIGGTHYRFKFSICCSGFGRSLVLEIRDSAGSTILCAGYPTGLANCPPVYLTYYFFASSCSLLSPDDLQVTITETSP